jgi:uncharacterized protein YdaU (DUF1376 family)
LDAVLRRRLRQGDDAPDPRPARAYFLLLLACWDGGGRLPNEPGQLAAIVKATPAEWRKLAPVILPYFEDHGAYLVHDRVVKEHAKAARLSEVRRESGLKGGRPPKQNESNQKPIGSAKANQTGLQTETPSPSPLPVRLYPQPVEVIEPSVSGQAAPTKGARLKPDWRPSADNYAYAVAQGFTAAGRRDRRGLPRLLVRPRAAPTP